MDGTGEALHLIATATGHDGVAPLSEHGLLQLRGGPADGLVRVFRRDGGLVAYGQLQLDTGEAEMVVHPGHRRQGHGRALLRKLREEAGGTLRVWAHGDLPGAVALAASEGLDRDRVLLQLRRPLAEPPPPAPPAEGVRLRTFRPRADEDAWLEVNRRAFAGHPEQGAWTMKDLRDRQREPWFDPAGFFLAERGGRVVGFHWTKVHSPDLGEVYVLGVDPDAQGLGLGRTLAVEGLRHLRERGLGQALLYVEESNPVAVGLYESLGFTRYAVDVLYRWDV